MKRTCITLAISLILTAGCQTPPDNSAQISQLETRVAGLEQKVEELATRSEGTAVDTVTSPAPGATASPVPATGTETAANSNGPLWKSLNYETLPNPEKLKEIVALGFLPKLGITDQSSLEGELTRGQYVGLLVEMNNLVHPTEQHIRLAREGDGQAFEDVPPSHPYYPYIQGMVDGGYVIGFDEKTFQPDKLLTREELVAIAAKRDYDFTDFDSKYFWEHYAPFTDKEKIAPKYRDAISRDSSASPNSNLAQAFGELKLLHPKQNVRAYEAVLSLEGVGAYSGFIYDELVNKAMGRTPD